MSVGVAFGLLIFCPNSMPGLPQDSALALRSLRRSPIYSVVAILTLALGIGANTDVFSLLNSVLLKPLPYPEPERLVLLWESAPFFGLRDSPAAPANYFDWKERSRSFEEMGALEDASFRLSLGGSPEVIPGSRVTASLLRALRPTPLLGRIFRDEEDQPDAAKAVILSEELWRKRFGADPGILGRIIRLDSYPYAVVGVFRRGTEPPGEYRDHPGDLWVPMGSAYTAAGLAYRGRHNWMVIARLKPDVSIAQADDEMKRIGRQLSAEYPQTNEKVGAFAAPMRDHFVSSRRTVLFALMGAVLFVLGIACVNLAHLLLARAASQGKEVAVRKALGAGVWPLMRRYLAEGCLLCLGGVGLGVFLGWFGLRTLAHLAPGAVAGMNQLSLDWRVLIFTLCVACLTVLLFTLTPFLQLRVLDVQSALKLSTRSVAASTAGPRWLRALLLGSEVALAFVLLIGAGLLIQTLSRLRGVDPGWRSAGLLTLRLPVHDPDFTPQKNVAFQNEILRRVLSLPGVLSAGFTNHIPLRVKGDITGAGAEGHPPETRFQCRSRMAGAGYFQTMGIPLVRGRDFSHSDTEGAPLVAVINQTLARLAWPEQDPIGKHLVLGGHPVPVVGVIRDIRQAGLDQAPAPEFYVSSLQMLHLSLSLVIQTALPPESLEQAVREQIRAVDPEQVVTDVSSMQAIMDEELWGRSLQTKLLGGFAALALFLAALGLYGVQAYSVEQRIPEIGLRMSLGAQPCDILRQITTQGLSYAAAGLAAGVLAALGVTRWLQSLLHGVEPGDPTTFVAAGAVLMLATLLASALPVRRAMRVDPAAALRQE